jgi:hypothetical protein
VDGLEVGGLISCMHHAAPLHVPAATRIALTSKTPICAGGSPDTGCEGCAADAGGCPDAGGKFPHGGGAELRDGWVRPGGAPRVAHPGTAWRLCQAATAACASGSLTAWSVWSKPEPSLPL